MTTRMDLDRRLAGWFADEAQDRAPDRLLEDTMRLVELTTQRSMGRGEPLASVVASWRTLTPTRRLMLAAALLIATFAAGAAAALLLRPPDPPGLGLVLVRYQDPGDPSSGVVILEHRETTTQELLSLNADALGGTWNGYAASLGPSGLLALGLGTAQDDDVVILDLRGHEEPRRLDTAGQTWSWAPDGQRIATSDDTGTFVFDVATGESTRLAVGSEPLISMGGSLVWAADGSGFLSDPGIETVGVMRLDGTFVPGRVPRFDPGVGPRRVRGDGALLRCHVTRDDQCEPWDRSLMAVGGSTAPVWVNDDLPVAIADYAWTTEGGIWVLTETAGPGPRTLTLLRVDPDGTESLTASFEAGADDPDPNAYCPAGRFEAMAPDDSLIAFRVTGEDCADAGLQVLDVATLEMVAVEGTVAGWLDPMDLEDSREPLPAASEVPSAVVGYWGRVVADPDSDLARGPVWLSIRPLRARIDQGAGQLHDFSLTAIDVDTIRFTAARDDLGCREGLPVTYAWRAAPTGLSLSAVDDPCPDRRALLEGTFERALPFTGRSTMTAEPGADYLVPPFGVHITVPSVGRTTVSRRDESSIGLRTDTASGHWVLERAPGDASSGGLATAMSAVEVAFDVAAWTPTTVAGAPAVTGTLGFGASTRWTTTLWPGDEQGGFVLQDGARVTLFEGPRGTVYSIVAWAERDAGDDVWQWADALTDSIDFAAD